MSSVTRKQSSSHPQPIVLFDGVCNLCNASVQSIVRWDKHSRFRFCSLQSERASELLAGKPELLKVDSVVLVVGKVISTESTAVLQICRLLGGLPALAYAAILVPRFIRDAIYRYVARNRYRWFGQRESCMIPTPELRQRFVD